MKKVFIVMVVLLVIVGLLGIFVPKEYVVEKKIIINRPSEAVFFSLKNFKSHAAWNPLSRIDRNIEYTYEGLDGTVGFIVRWKGNNSVGEGQEEIKEVIEGERILYTIRSSKLLNATSVNYFLVKKMYDEQTEVTWGVRDTLDFPANVIFHAGNMKKNMGYIFDEGLQVLKAILEKDLEKEAEETLEREKESIKENVKAISDELSEEIKAP